jgi:endonuclease YncB( thermonuclease family)
MVQAFAGTLLLSPGGDEADADAPIAAATDRFSCKVAYVNDGDTLRCADGVRVRLHAVAAREMDETCSPGHPCPAASATSAKAQLARLVGGEAITCPRTGKSYNRITAICWTPAQVEVNCAMIRSGTTVVWERFDREKPICRSSEV